MLLILLEGGTMRLWLELKKSKMVEGKFKSQSKFIIKMVTKMMKMESISDSLITKKNMTLFQLKLHPIALWLKSLVMNLPNL